jgi:hypothetical protein
MMHTRLPGGKLLIESFFIHGLILSNRPLKSQGISMRIRIPGPDLSTIIQIETGDELKTVTYTYHLAIVVLSSKAFSLLLNLYVYLISFPVFSG